MALTAVFLDLGNTLLVERVSRAALYAEEARAVGLQVCSAEMGARMARAHATLPREIDGAFRYSDAWFRAFQRRIFVQELGLEAGSLESLSQRLFARFEEARTFCLYPGARELLSELHSRGMRIGLISNWSERLPRLLAALDLDAAFDFVLGSAEMGVEKPDRAIFEMALRLARARPESCLHAGDDLECDARGAMSVGIPAVLVDHQRRIQTRELGPCPIVGSLAELRELILERIA